MRAAFDFGLLIAPIEPARFIAEFWEKRPLVVARQSPDYYSNLCSLADIDRILSSTDLRYPAIRLQAWAGSSDRCVHARPPLPKVRVCRSE